MRLGTIWNSHPAFIVEKLSTDSLQNFSDSVRNLVGSVTERSKMLNSLSGSRKIISIIPQIGESDLGYITISLDLVRGYVKSELKQLNSAGGSYKAPSYRLVDLLGRVESVAALLEGVIDAWGRVDGYESALKNRVGAVVLELKAIYQDLVGEIVFSKGCDWLLPIAAVCSLVKEFHEFTLDLDPAEVERAMA